MFVAAVLAVTVTDMRAEVTPFSESYSSESTTEGWTTSLPGVARFTPTILSNAENYFLSVKQGERARGCVVTGNILAGKAEQGDNFTLSFDMILGNNSDVSHNALTSFEIMDEMNVTPLFSLSAYASYYSNVEWTVNYTDTKIALPNSGYSRTGLSQLKWYSYKISRIGKLTYVTIVSRDTGEKIKEMTMFGGSSATGGLGNIVFSGYGTYANFAIDNIELREYQEGDSPSTAETSYSIKYQNEDGEQIKADSVVYGEVGSRVAVASNRLSDIWATDMKYIYKTGNDSITLVADATQNSITLHYREAKKYSYVVRQKYDNNEKILSEGDGFENEVITIYYPGFIHDGSTLYRIPAKTTNPHYGVSMLMDDNQEIDVNYDKYLENVVYYKEAEEMDGFTPIFGNYSDIRCSNGKGGIIRSEEPVVLVTLPAGNYSIYGQLWGGTDYQVPYVATITANGVSVLNMRTTGASVNYTGTAILDKETTLYISNTGVEADNKMLDLIYIRRIEGEPTFVAELNTVDSTLTFKKGFADATSSTIRSWELPDTVSVPMWYYYRNYVAKVVFEESFAEARPKVCSYWFHQYVNLKAVEGIENLNTSETTDMRGMFNECSALQSLDVSHFDTKNVTNMFYMFRNCSSLRSLDVSKFDTGNVTDMGWMFCADSLLTSLDVSHFNTGNVTRMTSMFWGCESLTQVDVSRFNTEKVTSMAWMFNGCTNLTELDVSNFNTANVTEMNNMFWYCRSLENLDVSHFNTANVSTMADMFGVCDQLKKLDVSQFNTENVTDMSYMFCNCYNLTSLNLSNFDTKRVKDMSSMFCYDGNLKTIYVSDKWTTDSIANDNEDMFSDCVSLKGGMGTVYDKNHIDYTYARIDGGTDAPGYFTDIQAAGIADIMADSNNRKSAIYSISGRKEAMPRKGINIIDGKKVLVK